MKKKRGYAPGRTLMPGRAVAVAVLSIILGLASVSASIAEKFESDADVPVLDGVELMDRDPDHPITIVVEERSIVPAQELLTLSRRSDVLLEIQEGPARFLYKTHNRGDMKSLTKIAYRASHVRLPAVVHGDEKHDSYISIVVNGSVVCERLRVTALPKAVFELYGELPSLADAILRLDLAKGYALVDESKMDSAAIILDYLGSPKFQKALANDSVSQGFNFKAT